MRPPHARVHEIDGIRGWAALCVLFFHLLWEIFGHVRPEIRSPLGRIFLDGKLAVYVFFILSGDALSLGFTSGGRLTPRVVLKRYARLAGPILFSCLVVYALMKLGLNANPEAAALVGRMDWLGNFLQFEPDLWSVLKHGLRTVFTEFSVSTSYNPFLWPMGIELAGSALVFCLGFAFHAVRWPRILLLVAALYLLALGSIYVLFLIGILFGTLRNWQPFSIWREKRVTRAMCLGLLLATFLANSAFDPTTRNIRMEIIFATLIVGLCYASRDVVALMSGPASRYLGRISFPLYFMHFAVIISLTSWLITVLVPTHGTGWAVVVLVTVISVCVVLTIADVTERAEDLYLRQVDRVIRYFLAQPTRASDRGV